MSDPTISFVDDPSELGPALRRVTDELVGVDVERADSHRYFRRAALIQVGDADHCVLVDPLAVTDLRDLDAFLRERQVVLHAIENDIEPLAAAGVEPTDVADTGVAAAVLGLPIGLGPLLEEVLGVVLDTDKDTYQRADWEQRPLSAGMREYAAGDVFHLPALWRALGVRLEEAGRRSWYEQELVATLDNARADTRDWQRTKGAGRLDPQQRAVLKALWEERESISREHDIAPNRLLHDRTLLALAEQPASSSGEMVRRNQRRSSPLKAFADRLLAAQEDGRTGPPVPKEGGGRRWSDAERDAYDAMRRARAELADELGIDAGVLCPSRPLWTAAVGEPADAAELCALAELRPWQAELLADVLWDAYASALARDGDDGEQGSEEE
ncbi:MAG: ribonuclease D [Actinomycetes bacterium]